MYDVYVNDRNGLLILDRGRAVPTVEVGAWRKKRTVRSVSAQICDDVRLYGYHARNLALRPKIRADKPS